MVHGITTSRRIIHRLKALANPSIRSFSSHKTLHSIIFFTQTPRFDHFLQTTPSIRSFSSHTADIDRLTALVAVQHVALAFNGDQHADIRDQQEEVDRLKAMLAAKQAAVVVDGDQHPGVSAQRQHVIPPDVLRAAVAPELVKMRSCGIVGPAVPHRMGHWRVSGRCRFQMWWHTPECVRRSGSPTGAPATSY